MSTNKKSHTGLRNGNLFCFNCGQSFDMQLPKSIAESATVTKSFDQLHQFCAKTWSEPIFNQDDSVKARLEGWWNFGQRGMSAECIYHFMTGNPSRNDHPWDPVDFKRCYGLFKAVPELKARLPEMKRVSQTWSNLIDNWDKLSVMLEEQIATGKPNGMYEFMQTLIVR